MSDLFEELEPPPGGLGRLQERLDRLSERRRFQRRATGGLALAAAVVIAVTVSMPVAPNPIAVRGLALLSVPTSAVEVRVDSPWGHVLVPVSVTDEVVYVRMATVGVPAEPE